MIHFGVATRSADTAILRFARCDIESAHNFKAIGDSAVYGLRYAIHRMQHAINTHAEDRLIAAGLNVNITGALLEGIMQQIFHGRNNRLA